MFRGKRSPADTRSFFLPWKCPFLSVKEFRLQMIFGGRKDFLPVEAKAASPSSARDFLNLGWKANALRSGDRDQSLGLPRKI
jgi:hypothetical protein